MPESSLHKDHLTPISELIRSGPSIVLGKRCNRLKTCSRGGTGIGPGNPPCDNKHGGNRPRI